MFDAGPAVTIGIPNYQRPDGLARCLASLTAQLYRNIRIVVADDCSPDPRVRDVMTQAAARDARITCIHHSANKGMFANFWHLLENATTPYFMWSSNDDYWDPRFVARMVGLLEANPRAALACGGIRHFTSDGVSSTIYSPARFTSTGDRQRDLERFLREPEILGKSHPLYGLYRTDELREAARSLGFGAHDRWSEDVIMVFSMICRHDTVAIGEPFLYKRRPEGMEFAPRHFAADFGVASRHFREYTEGLMAACATAEQRALVRRVMWQRRAYKILVTSWRKPLMRKLAAM
ncbi:MAG: glycosyltransferase family 2 protein [Xanthobacteraceae bacterium]|nr:MAG: glycosyltransferase family 2 protein [Xanthobacteraceae bacterium]